MLEKSVPPVARPTTGITMSFTRESTMRWNAAPMMTPTARSMTLPLAMNSLNSFSMAPPPSILPPRYNWPVPISLTTRERARLKARAHALAPNVSVGNAGATTAVIAEVDRALAKHELIKVKIQGDDREVRKQIG